MDNTLELLKSLTQGVNNKVSQEQKSYEYIVNTSLKNKNKKSTPPIVKEVIKDKKEEKKEVEEPEIFYDFIDTDEVVDEIIGDISENFDETSDVVYDVIEEDIVFEENIDSVIVEDGFIVDEIIDETITEDNIFLDVDAIVEDDSLDIVEDVMPDIEILEGVEEETQTDNILDIGHISEDLSVTKKEAQKIQRNGNPFKRGPRKKKNKEVVPETPIVESTPVVEKSEVGEFLDFVNELNDVDEKEDVIVSDEVIDNSDVLIDTVEDDGFEEVDLQFLDDSEFSELFKDEEDEGDIVSDSSVSLDDDDFDKLDSLDDSEDFAEIEDDILDEKSVQVSVEEPEIEEAEDVFDEVSVEEPLVEPEMVERKDNFVEIPVKTESKVEEPIVEVKEEVPVVSDEKEMVVSEDDKFKNCKYYKGMDVEEFLRENPNYREAMYVEHFYSKEYLNKMIVSGLLLMKKGKYRF